MDRINRILERMAQYNIKITHLIDLREYLNALDEAGKDSELNCDISALKASKDHNLPFEIVEIIKKEPGLTYAEAYAALELAKIILKTESQFVTLEQSEK